MTSLSDLALDSGNLWARTMQDIRCALPHAALSLLFPHLIMSQHQLLLKLPSGDLAWAETLGLMGLLQWLVLPYTRWAGNMKENEFFLVTFSRFLCWNSMHHGTLKMKLGKSDEYRQGKQRMGVSPYSSASAISWTEPAVKAMAFVKICFTVQKQSVTPGLNLGPLPTLPPW